MAQMTFGMEQLPQNIAYAKGQMAGMPNSGGAAGGGGSTAGLGGAIAGGIGGLMQLGFGIPAAIKNNKLRKLYAQQAEQELASMPEYNVSPYAKAELAQAQANNNAISPAAAMLYRQAQLGAANTAAVGQRNAASGAEAINAAIMGQQAAQAQMPNIAEMQQNYAMQNRAALARAMQGMTQEQQNVFQARLNRNQTRMNYRLGQLGGANANYADAVKGIQSGASALGSTAGNMLDYGAEGAGKAMGMLGGGM